MTEAGRFTAVVLAGDRKPDDPVARAAGVACKALAPVGGTPMVLRVLDALAGSVEVTDRLLCGPPQAALDESPVLQSGIRDGRCKWIPNQATPSASAYAAMSTLPDATPVLLTTADHALLNPAMVDHFCAEARAGGCDVVAALVRYEAVISAYPGVRRTAIRLQDDAYCGCNLFAFMTERGRAAADFWRRVESQRKKPVQIVTGVLGWLAVLRYLLGRLPLNVALEGMSRRLGLRLGVVIMPWVEASIDVDTADDWRFVEKILDSAAGNGPARTDAGSG
jgi:CTP:molybdopterin cytidylyltransferase MocA